MYDELMAEAAARLRKYGEDLQPPCAPEALDDLRKRARGQLRYEIPEAYAAFLGKADGIDWNGFCFYATSRTLIVATEDRFIPGFVEANLEWRESASYRDQVIFGHSGNSNYAFHLKDQAWQIRDQPSDRLVETVESFEHLLFRAFEEHRPPAAD